MRRHFRVYAIISAVGLALLALIAVQAYWVYHTYALSERQFMVKARESVRETIREVNDQVVCFEVFSRVHVNPNDGLYILKHRFEGDRFLDSKQSPPDTVPLLSDEPRYNITFQTSSLRFSYPVNLNLLVQYEYLPSEEDTADLFSDLSLANYRQASQGPAESKYPPGLLDSTLRKNFARAGISGNFNFGILDKSSGTLVYRHGPGETDLNGTGAIRELLTPSRYFSRPLELAVSLDNYAGGIFLSMGRLLVVSAAVVLILLASFLVFARIILRQRKLSELKNDFINNITHEFKTPLTNIALAIESISERSFDKNEGDQQLLKIITQETERLRENTDRILEISKYEKERLRLSLEQIDLHQLIRKVVSSFAGFSSNEAIDFGCSFRASAPVVRVDEVHFFNCIFNLIDNAVKYNVNRPKIAIATETLASGTRIVVTDNGIGISPADQSRVFEKFYRVQGGDLHDVKGYGLGLSYVKLIVEAHRGQIRLSSRPGVGSSFEIEIPYL